MKKLLLALALCLCASPVWAQCAGVFPANTICGNLSGTANVPSAVPFAAGTIAGPTVSTSGWLPSWVGTSGLVLNSQQTIITSQNFTFTGTLSSSGANNFTNTNSLFVANITSNLYYKGTLINLIGGPTNCSISATSSGYVFNGASLGCLTSGTLTNSAGIDTETGQLKFIGAGINFPLVVTTSVNGQAGPEITNNTTGANAGAGIILSNGSVTPEIILTGTNWNNGGIGAPNSILIGFGGGATSTYIINNTTTGLIVGLNGAVTIPTSLTLQGPQTVQGILTLQQVTVLSPYTVATLPGCGANNNYQIATISNGAAGSTYYSNVLAIGTSPNIVMCNGTGWTYH